MRTLALVNIHTEKIKIRWKFWAYDGIAVWFIQMIRDWHFRSSRKKISLVAGVCVHRQRQIQMSHQHVRSWGFIQVQHVGVIEHQTIVHFSRVSTGSFPDMTCWDHLYSGKAPANADIYYSMGYICIESITYLLKLANITCVTSLTRTNHKIRLLFVAGQHKQKKPRQRARID